MDITREPITQEQITQEQIDTVRMKTVAALRASVEQTFLMMTGMQAVVGEAVTELRPQVVSGRLVASLLGWIGPWNGTGILECTPDFACKVAEALLGDESTVLTESTLDCMAEISNIVFGTMKTEIEALVGSLGLSTPTVVYGDNVGMRNIGENFLIIPVEIDGHHLRIKISMMPVNLRQTRPSHFWGGHYNTAPAA